MSFQVRALARPKGGPSTHCYPSRLVWGAAPAGVFRLHYERKKQRSACLLRPFAPRINGKDCILSQALRLGEDNEPLNKWPEQQNRLQLLSSLPTRPRRWRSRRFHVKQRRGWIATSISF